MGKLEQLQAQYGDNVAESTAGPRLSPGTNSRSGPPPRPAHLIGVERARSAALIELDRIDPDPDQPRKEFTEDQMEEMVESLREKGQLQPIRVRFDEASGRYRLIMGERRFRAAKLAGLKSMAAVIHEGDLSPAESLEIQLIENTVRADLKPIELAAAMRRLMAEFGYTQQDVGHKLKMTQSAVSRALSMLDLDPAIQAKVDEGVITTRAAQQIARIESPAEQLEIADQVERGKLSEDETAGIVKQARSKAKGRGGTKAKARPKLKTLCLYSGSGIKLRAESRKGIDPATLRAVLLQWAETLDASEAA